MNNVIIAKNKHAKIVENLRFLSYCTSKSFQVMDKSALRDYCKWSPIDEMGIVLLSLKNNNEAISTIRGNVYHKKEELELYDNIFLNNVSDSIFFPTLNITLGATSTNYRSTGLLPLLLHYIYKLHRHSVKSIVVSVVKESYPYKVCLRHGFNFRSIETIYIDVLPFNKWMLGNIDIEEINVAIKLYEEMFASKIKEFPFTINA